MRGQENRQKDFLSHAIYDSLIPTDHFFRRLSALLDWSALARPLEDCYRHKGRPSVPPEIMLRIMVLQYLFDRSDRQIEEDLRMHLGYKFFAGLEPDQAGPDHSTLSRFRGRVGAGCFARLFNSVVEAARAAGVVGDRLHAIDSRAVSANVNSWRQRDRQMRRRDEDEPPPGGGMVRWEGEFPDSPDPDAATGAKSDSEFFYGYKHHLAVDVDTGLIVSGAVTPGDAHDGATMPEVLDERAGAVVADKGYDSRKNHDLLAAKGIGDRIIRRRGGNGAGNSGRYVVERANAIVKRWCGGGRARYWGLEKVSIQMALASLAANLKRLMSLGVGFCPLAG